MQVTEKSTEGLKRTLQIVVGAGELNERFDERLGEIKDRVQLKGFRKGKVPVTHLRKVYGRSVMLEVLDQAVKDTSTRAITDRKERPAHQPAIELPEDKDEIERVLSGQADLSYVMSFEVLPEIEVADLSHLKLERLVADVEDDVIDKAVGQLVDRSTRYEAEEGREAGDGDRLAFDYVGKIDGEPFEGGSGENATLVLGHGTFIPGFEDGLKGAKAGESRVVAATFPADYPAAHLAGKAATFDVTVKEVAKPIKPEVNDEFAKSLGAESVPKLRELVSAQIAREYAGIARMKLKRELLDALEAAHSFALPPTLVDNEFEAIWHEYMHSLEHAGKTPADEGRSEDEAKAEYRKLAERRVRLGLLIAEIGEQNKIEVTQDELRQALMDQARRYPGQERLVYEHYQKNPGALGQLRAPIFEEKVVDFLLERVKPAEKKVGREELLKQAGAATDA